MKKIALMAVLSWMSLGALEAQAQILFYRPPSTPYVAPIGPFGSPYGFGSGAPFGGLFGQGMYAPTTGPSPNAPGYSGPGITGRTTISRQGGDETDPRNTNVTGHSTRFLYYSHYFMNQGGGSTTSAQQQTSTPNFQQPGFLVGGNYARSQPGIAPRAPARPAASGRR